MLFDPKNSRFSFGDNVFNVSSEVGTSQTIPGSAAYISFNASIKSFNDRKLGCGKRVQRGSGFNASRKRRQRERSSIRSLSSGTHKKEKMRDHHAMRCSGRFISPPGVMK